MDYKYSPSGSGTGDIFLRQSYNSGNNWGSTIELVYNHKAFKSDLAVNGDTVDVVWDDETHGLFQYIIQYVRSTDGGENWSPPLWLDSAVYESSWDPALAVSDGHVYIVWNAYRGMPDSSALYFSYSPYEPTSVGNQRDTNLPDNIELSAYPNPFNSSTVIEYDLAVPSEVSIGIFDILGRRVETIEQGRQPAGNHSVIWDATGQSSGIYFYRLKAGDKTETRKMILMK